MKRNSVIDFCKFIAAIMVVAVHTTRNFGIDSNFGFWVINVFCRLAVPFFAVCSGYFLSVRWAEQSKSCEEVVKTVIKNQIKKTVYLYGIWIMVYLIYSVPQWIETGWFSLYAFIDYGIASVKVGAHYHLWYLLSLIYALPLFGFLLSRLSAKNVCLVALVLWFIKAMSYGYRFLLPVFWVKVLLIPDIFPGLRDALFCLLPFMLIGAYSHKAKECTMKQNTIGLSISLFGLSVEAFWLRSQGQMATSFIFMTMPTAFFLFGMIIREIKLIHERAAMFLGKCSLLIYCIHPIFGEMTEKLIINNGVHFGLTTFFSVIVSGIIISGLERVCQSDSAICHFVYSWRDTHRKCQCDEITKSDD